MSLKLETSEESDGVHCRLKFESVSALNEEYRCVTVECQDRKVSIRHSISLPVCLWIPVIQSTAIRWHFCIKQNRWLLNQMHQPNILNANKENKLHWLYLTFFLDSHWNIPEMFPGWEFKSKRWFPLRDFKNRTINERKWWKEDIMTKQPKKQNKSPLVAISAPTTTESYSSIRQGCPVSTDLVSWVQLLSVCLSVFLSV